MKTILTVIVITCAVASAALADERSDRHHQRTQELRQQPAGFGLSEDADIEADTPGFFGMQVDPVYEEMLVRSRARRRPVSHNGAVIYNVTTIRNYDAGEHSGLLGGNLNTERHKLYIGNITVVKDSVVRSIESDIELGNIVHYGDAEDLFNMVDIQGTMAVGEASLGNIMNVGSVNRVHNSLTIGGNVIGP